MVLYAESNVIAALQSPVWLQRDNTIRALKVGDEIITGDKIRTGANARVLIRLGEGSDVKLGEKTRWILQEHPDASTNKIFSALMVVVKGAFRFTTTKLSKNRKRKILARLNTATIGIRGTDVWGSVEEAKTFIVLIEGNIEIEENGQTTAMSDPLSLFSASNNSPAEPLSTINLNDLSGYAEQTELQVHKGVQSVGGRWQLNLASYREQENVERLQGMLNKDGYRTFLERITLNGKAYTRVVMTEFSTHQDANFMRSQINTTYELTPWVSATR